MQPFRPTKQQHDMIYSFIAELVHNRNSEVTNKSGKVSPNMVIKLTHDELGIDLSKQTVIRILKKDLSKVKDKRPISNENIKDIIKQLNVLDGIIGDVNSKPNDKIRASGAYSNLMKTKLAWEKQSAEIDIRKAETLRPIYTCNFGHYNSALKKCPKCGYKFYDVPGKEKKEEDKPFFKAGSGQATIEDVEK